jgi:hypothetical protein
MALVRTADDALQTLLSTYQAARAAEVARRAEAKAAAGAPPRCAACFEPPAALLGLRLALRSPLFRRLTSLVVLTAVAGDALSDVTTQYLQLRLGFGPREQAAYLMTVGVCGIAVQACCLRPLLARVGERGAIVVGCGCFAAKLLLLCVPLLTLPVAFAAAAVGTGAELIFPAISALKANAAAPHEQGAVQGGLFAARALAAGLGPLPWAALFRACTRTDRGSHAPPQQAPFALAAVLALLAAGIAARLPVGGAVVLPVLAGVLDVDAGEGAESRGLTVPLLRKAADEL